MYSESDPTVTRVTVVLNKPGYWFDWLFVRKDSCFRHDLWQYVNPETLRHSLPVLTEPPEPELSSVGITTDTNVN